ncbi:hypothetical protein JOB18_041598 [Solea senegalensis]|uniref:Uncharacterized protein n=1 Tax=Solea senegalensis TaxID=28829 RepID=A0AAV6SJC9_SOLSE|nr:hypothetical protein JOB18_041598 [Solea senegalensis]
MAVKSSSTMTASLWLNCLPLSPSLCFHEVVPLKTDMKTKPGHSGAPEARPRADAATRPPLSFSHRPQALKTAPRLINQEHNEEAAGEAAAAAA